MDRSAYAPVQTSGYVQDPQTSYRQDLQSGYAQDPQTGYAQEPQSGYPVEGYLQQNNTRAIKPSTIAIGFLCLLLIWFFFFKKDATYGEWSEWSSCSKPCGTNATKERTRKYIPAQYGGTDIPEASRKLTETQDCTDLPLCNDGSYTEWRTKNPCKTRFSDDFLEEERSYIPADYGGVDIPVASRVLTRKSPCGTQPRPVNDYFTDYIDVEGSACRKEQNRTSPVIVCGTGWKEQVRTYVPAQPGGVNTLNSSDTTRWVSCTAPKPVCQTRNGSCTDWLPSGDCFNGFALFTRIYNEPVDGGEDNSCKHELSTNRLNNISYHCGQLENSVTTGCIGAHNQQKRTITQRYTLPSLYNNEPIKPYDSAITSIFDSNTINEIRKLGLNNTLQHSKYRVTKIQTAPQPDVVEISYTEDCPLTKLSNTSIENVWKNSIGCNEPLGTSFPDNFDSNNFHLINQNENVFNSRNLVFDTEGNVRSKLSKYNLDYILEKQNTSTNFDNLLNMINRCNKSRVLSETDASRLSSRFTQKNRLYPGLCYKRITLTSGSYRLVLGGSKNMELFHNNNMIWEDSVSRSTDNNICMQTDGNFVIYNIKNEAIYAAGTHGNIGAYLELTNTGFIVIKNKNNKIIKCIPEPRNNNRIRDHIKNNHWDGSPWTLFSDKRGGVWKAQWREIDNGDNLNWMPHSGADYSRFKGWRRNHDDPNWNVTERNLNHHLGYNHQLNENRPRSRDDHSDNYNSSNDRQNFHNDSSQSRKPPQLVGGIEKPNYIPGYDRISYTTAGNDDNKTFRFLISARPGTQWDQAFVLYRIKDREAYANDIINNHPQLVYNVFLHLSGLSDNDFDNSYRESLNR